MHLSIIFKTAQFLVYAFGHLIVARIDVVKPCMPVMEGEALGLLLAIQFFLYAGMQNVDFETDCKGCVDRKIK